MNGARMTFLENEAHQLPTEQKGQPKRVHELPWHDANGRSKWEGSSQWPRKSQLHQLYYGISSKISTISGNGPISCECLPASLHHPHLHFLPRHALGPTQPAWEGHEAPGEKRSFYCWPGLGRQQGKTGRAWGGQRTGSL